MGQAGTLPAYVGSMHFSPDDNPTSPSGLSPEAVRRLASRSLASEEHAEALSMVSAGLAHDLRNLLWVIQLECAALDESLPADEDARASVEAIREATERGVKLAGHLMEAARVEPGTPAPLVLGDALEASEAFLRRLAGEPVSVRVEVGPDVWPVHIDRGRLDQILTNLVVNARQAMPDGGELSLSATNLVSDLSEAPMVCLSVRDSGHGMSKEVQRRIFDPFFTTRPGTGTGLGMAVVRRLVERVGGVVRLQSEVGKGTLVEVLLPRADVAQTA